MKITKEERDEKMSKAKIICEYAGNQFDCR